MSEVPQWEVVWSKDQPFIIYRSQMVFKIYKLKVEKKHFITAPLKTKNGQTNWEVFKEDFCNRFNLDQGACRDAFQMYRELYKLEF